MATIEQCVFGYDDGHRLLAASLRMPPEVVSQLTVISDLAPGTVFGSPAFYWTGLPVPKLGRYALMCTWAAPEMPRPGCVWTHALLFDTQLFEELPDLSMLRNAMRRPSSPLDRTPYSAPIEWTVEGDRTPGGAVGQSAFAKAMMATLYGDGAQVVPIDQPGQLDDLTFAIWSQQWPRLRRNFRFQTAASREPGHLRERFDLRFHLWRAIEPAGSADTDAPAAQWLEVAMEDLEDPNSTGLRHFLWRYGRDVKRQRGSFRPLVQAYIGAEGRGAEEGSGIADRIAEAFPDPTDAITLKSDLLRGEVAPDQQLAGWRALIATGSIPQEVDWHQSVSDLVDTWWRSAPDAVVATALFAFRSQTESTEAFAGEIAARIDQKAFSDLIGEDSEFALMLLERRPELLSALSASDLKPVFLSELAAALPEGSLHADALAMAAYAVADPELIGILIDRFSDAAVKAFISGLDSAGTPLPAWKSAFAKRPELLLDPDRLRAVQRTNSLYEIAETVGWLEPVVVEKGVGPWHEALVGIRSDLPADETDILRCFLLALAIERGGSGTAEIFEKNFMPVHDRILKSYLPWRGSEMLMSVCPWIGYYLAWDIGRRFRLGVAQAYVKHGLSPTSFAKLTRNRALRRDLDAAAAEVRGGDVLLRDRSSRRIRD